MNPIAIDPHVALTLAEYKQASVRASFPRKPARRLLAPVRRSASPGVTAVPRTTVRVPAPRRTTDDPVPAGRA